MVNKYVKIHNPQHEKILRTMSEDMLKFGKVCMPNMFQVKSPDFHMEIAETLMDETLNKVNITAPRGHGKSSLVACIYPLWHIFFDDRPKLIALVSKTEGHAIRLLQSIKDVLEYSIPLRTVMGYWGMHSARTWKEREVVLKDNTLIVCKGMGQQMRGLKHGDQRPTLIILDDAEDEMNTKTSEAMEINLRWFLQSPIPAVDPTRGKVVVIGTPQHQRCLVETLKQMSDWKNLEYKAVYGDLTMEGGRALWEEWYPLERLLKEKESLESINRVSSWYREFQCQVIGDEDQLFKKEYFRYYDGEHLHQNGYNYLKITKINGVPLQTPDIRPVSIFMGIDPASSTKQTADYSTIVAIAVDAERNKFILPYYRAHAKPLALAEKIIEYYHRYKPDKTRIESVGYQEMLREYVRSREFIPGLEIKEQPRTSKSNRLETLEPTFYKRQFYLMENMSELIDELILYPRGKHDDLLDGLYYANKNAWTPSHDTEALHLPKSSLMTLDDLMLDDFDYEDGVSEPWVYS